MGMIDPDVIAFTPDNHYAFVGGDINTVSVLDVSDFSSSLLMISVGQYPDIISITPDGNSAFIANINDGIVSVIDVNSLGPIPQTIAMADKPIAIAVTPDSSLVFIVHNSGVMMLK